MGWSHNDTLQLGASTSVLSSSVSGQNVKFNVTSGSITYQYADHKFMNIRNSSGVIDTYILNGTNTVKAVNNFSARKTLTDSAQKTFLYNAGSYSSINPDNGGKMILPTMKTGLSS